MKMFLQLGFILLAFCVVATGVLAYVNSITKPKITLLKINAAKEARSQLIPGSTFESAFVKTEKDSLEYFIARDETSKELKGYTFTASKTGYNSSSPIKTMVAVDSMFKVIDIRVVDQKETPGLGTNSTDPKFSNQFRGLTEDQLMVDKDGGKIKSLTGATITSRAITNSLQSMISLVKKDVESKKTVQAPVEVIK